MAMDEMAFANGEYMRVEITFGEQEPGAVYWERPGAYLIAVVDGRLAAVRTVKGYFLPGGGLENGERHADCIGRECIEELGCGAEVGAYIGAAAVYTVHEVMGHFLAVQYFYAGALREQSAAPVELDHALEWIAVESAADRMVVPAQAWAIRKYLGR